MEEDVNDDVEGLVVVDVSILTAVGGVSVLNFMSIFDVVVVVTIDGDVALIVDDAAVTMASIVDDEEVVVVKPLEQDEDDDDIGVKMLQSFWTWCSKRCAIESVVGIPRIVASFKKSLIVGGGPTNCKCRK